MLEEFFIKRFDTLESTQSYAKTLLNTREAIPGMVISTLDQTLGFGRRQRDWLSLKGNIALTIILQPSVEEKLLAQISFITCIAVGETIKHFIPKVRVGYKWVNDIYIDDKKISGILLEKAAEFLFVGVGVNLQSNPAIKSNNGISLNDLGYTIQPNEFEEKLLANFRSLYNTWITYGFIKIKNMWAENAINIGQKVSIQTIEFHTEGIFQGIDDLGNAILSTSDGDKTITAGEMWQLS